MKIEQIVSGLNESAKIIHEGNKKRGFYDNREKNIGELLMLVVSELGEALEAHRKGVESNLKSFESDLKYAGFDIDSEFENSEIPWFVNRFKSTIKDGFEDEIADSVIRLLDICGYLEIDIDRHINLKLAYNSTRPHKHGKNY